MSAFRMREFAEPMNYAFKDVTSLYTPAYDETYRTKGANETHSTSFFCWSTKNDPSDYSPPLTFSHLVDDEDTGPLFPSMSDDIIDSETSPVLDDGTTIPSDGYPEMTSEMIFDYSAFDCMLMKEEGEVKVKEEPMSEQPQQQQQLQQQEQQQLNYTDQNMMNLFPSFQEEFKPVTPDQQNLDPFQLFGRGSLNQDNDTSNDETSTNLQNIIDECMSLESSFNSPDRLFEEELNEICSCRWLGCQVSFPSQDQLVSKSASLFLKNLTPAQRSTIYKRHMLINGIIQL